MATEPSGAGWAKRFPTSRSLGDLKGSFAANVKRFHAALVAAGAKVHVSATLRPPERAYLMHYAYMIAHGMDPEKVPAMSGVQIDWLHMDKDGKPDLKAALKGAKAMVAAYDIVHRPALKSRHTEGLAVDMTISWSGTLTITGSDKKPVSIKSSPRSGENKELQAVGEGYSVIKLKTDPPHWSSDGR
jgi:D-alanyl-D-alanine dipeptidase